MESLPIDMQIEILSQMNLEQLRSSCQSNRHFRKLCQQELIWEQLVRKNYGNVEKVDSSWQTTYIFHYQLVGPLINLLGWKNFLDEFLVQLITFMTIVPHEAKHYQIPLLPNMIEIIGDENPHQIDLMYQSLRNMRSVPPVNPYRLYRLDFDELFRDIDMIIENIRISAINNGLIPLENNEQQINLLNSLRDRNRLWSFLNASIPGLHYTSVHNPRGVLYDNRTLLNLNCHVQPSLNILETGEGFTYKIDKPNISMIDLLHAIMSVKSQKNNFWNEDLYGIITDTQQILTLDIGHDLC